MLVSIATSLSVSEQFARKRVGGKAASLIRLHQAGFDVPDGVVLTTRFFEPWLTDIQATSEWRAVLDQLRGIGASQPNQQAHADLASTCDRVKALAMALPYTADQLARVDQANTELGDHSLAVRSSSPDEDLHGASFAGLYETVLNVDPDSLTDAIRACFCSCVDQRVLLYKICKLNRPLADLTPSIAVILQPMVTSEVSGVAFSVNPITNDFDELLVNASWGLGDALVTGDITPDSVVVNKVTDDVISYAAGDKGGDRSQQRCLSDDQIEHLTEVVKRIEALYGEPMDVEWAIAANRLRVLQARTITSYVPLHPKLLTEPGAPRHLYMDGYLTDGITMSSATTPMSDNVFERVLQLFWQWVLHIPASALDPKLTGVYNDTSRMYLDLSMYLHLIGKGKRIAKQTDAMNPIMAGILTSPDIDRYRPDKPPPHMRKRRLLPYLPVVLWRARRAVSVLFGPLFRRDRFDASYHRILSEFDAWITRPLDHSQSVADCLTTSMTRAGSTIMESSYPAFMVFYTMAFRIKALVDTKSPEQVAMADAILSGHEDDMIVQMGLMLYDLSTLLPEAEFNDIEALATKLEQRRLPEEFLSRWDEFIQRYGCRGPLEMELATPKYGDSPLIALQQIAGMVAAGSDFNPYDMQRKQIERREAAYKNLMTVLSPRKAKRLQKYYAICVRYAASRELFKHHVMQVYARVRALLLHHADTFVRTGRLDSREQIFELTVDDVDLASRHPSFDIRAAVAERGAFARKLKSLVRHFPLVIDSRGRILRAPTKLEAGALVGAAVSPGIARGPIKVLNDPFEKPVEPGDVLVAVTTDPGWTPLFVGAAAVILEIGGELQHGALVAREYGKPCVSGIQDVTGHFEDGQIVEVDGNLGVIRFVDPPK